MQRPPREPSTIIPFNPVYFQDNTDETCKNAYNAFVPPAYRREIPYPGLTFCQMRQLSRRVTKNVEVIEEFLAGPPSAQLETLRPGGFYDVLQLDRRRPAEQLRHQVALYLLENGGELIVSYPAPVQTARSSGVPLVTPPGRVSSLLAGTDYALPPSRPSYI